MTIYDAQDKAPVASSWSVTHSRVVKLSNVWTIENFSFQEKNEVIVSPVFSATANDTTQWRLKIYPRGKKDDDRANMAIHLSLSSSTSNGVPAKYKISILSTENREVQVMRNDTPVMFRQGDSFGVEGSVSRDCVFGERDGCLPRDEFTVLCEIAALAEIRDVSGRNPAEQLVAPAQIRSGESSKSTERQWVQDASQRWSYSRGTNSDRVGDEVGVASSQSATSTKRRRENALNPTTGASESKQNPAFADAFVPTEPQRRGTVSDDLAAAASTADDFICREIPGLQFLGSRATRTTSILSQLRDRTAPSK